MLHVVFGDSAGGILRQGLRKAQVDEQILSFPDNLAYGPICGGARRRVAWCQNQFAALKDGSWLFPSEPGWADFWDQFNRAKSHKVIWLSRRSSREYCGFLECLYRTDLDDSVLINDLTEQSIPTSPTEGTPSLPVHSTSHLNVENLMRFYENWEVLNPDRRKNFLDEWELLRKENGHFRIFADTKLVSAPDSYFDESILSNLEVKWRKAPRVIAEVIQDHWGCYLNDVGFEILFARLIELIKDDRIAARGDPTGSMLLEVRRP